MPRKYAEVQNVPGCVVFYTAYLKMLGFTVDSRYEFTAVPTETARKLNLI